MPGATRTWSAGTGVLPAASVDAAVAVSCWPVLPPLLVPPSPPSSSPPQPMSAAPARPATPSPAPRITPRRPTRRPQYVDSIPTPSDGSPSHEHVLVTRGTITCVVFHHNHDSPVITRVLTLWNEWV